MLTLQRNVCVCCLGRMRECLRGKDSVAEVVLGESGDKASSTGVSAIAASLQGTMGASILFQAWLAQPYHQRKKCTTDGHALT